ncbi:hypothetical protein GIR22_01150 [Pseudomonas sp. CCM 7891]|uniref:Lipoprotein n=1 Tax=Pseudomonas karstica TaxID=1055468 RepID=A0A7X2RPW4_9PSED|nr:hypothetical protein [Pseudomonas karstica]MTD17755.1 hypothetical protein [Pseudomonas karstica]
MRMFMLTASLLTLAGCAGLPDPDPAQAWIDLDSDQNTVLHALETDDKAATDKRYFEVPPGRHELTVRYQFPVEATNIGPDAQRLWRDCTLSLAFKDFSAGERYQVRAGSTGFRPWAKLYSQDHKVISQAKPAGCQHS